MSTFACLNHIAVTYDVSRFKLRASTVEGYEEFAYVRMVDWLGRGLIGGTAFVVDRATGTVYLGTARRPSPFDCAAARAQLASAPPAA